jgi:TP901 family phage tail tape measure protein
MSAGAVRAGGVFVEIGADPRKFFSALTKVNKSLGNMGRSLASGGGKLAAAGIGMAAPIAAAVRQGAAFESTLLNIRASTGATSAQIDQIKASSMAMSQALGVGPTEAAQGMLELLKAGMSLDAVLGGAGQTALEFAKVGEMDVAQASVVMSDAMNVFKVSSDVAANALSSAADASSTSIAQMSEAFSMSSAVAGKAGLSIQDLSATLAILANNGVKGSDAGTSVKTMLMRLMAPAEDAAEAMAGVGLSVRSFVNQDTGKMLPMIEVVGKLNEALGPLDEVAKKQVLAKIFGADAIRAALILGDVGVGGFEEIQKAMSSALSVGDKYKVLQSGLAGAAGTVLASLERMAVAISDAVSPSLLEAATYASGFASGLERLVASNKEMVAFLAQLSGGLIASGGALTGVGLAIQAVSYGLGGLSKAAYVVVAPLALIVSTGFSIAASFVGALASVVAYATGAVAAATATAAAWGLANVPLIAMVGVFVALGGIAAGVVAGLLSGAMELTEAFGNAMQPSIERAGEAFVEIKRIGVDAFGAIRDAIAGGDLEGAMQVAIAGLQAVFSVGSRAFLDSVDEWGVNLVNAFDFYISQIPFLRFLGKDKYTFSVFGDSTSSTTADTRADERFAAMDNRKADRETKASAAVDAFNAIIQGKRVSPSQDVPLPPGQSLPTPSGMAGGTPFDAVINDLRKHFTPFAGEQSQAGGMAIDLPPLVGLTPPPPPPPTESMGAIAGTFSSLNLGAVFGGTSAAERTAKATEEIAMNTRNMKFDTVTA